MTVGQVLALFVAMTTMVQCTNVELNFTKYLYFEPDEESCGFLNCNWLRGGEVQSVRDISVYRILGDGHLMAQVSSCDGENVQDDEDLLVSYLLKGSEAELIINLQKEYDCQQSTFICAMKYESVESEIMTTVGMMWNTLMADDADWRLVFRATAHNNQGFMSSFNNAKLPAPDPSEQCDIVPSLTCKSNYRDIEAFNNWSDFTQALFAIYKGNDRVHYIIFDIKNTKIGQNWFRQDRIIESSWADLNYQSLSMAQNGVWVNGNYRRFTVVQTDRQPGFEFEAGWFMVVEPASGGCGFERAPFSPLLVYSKLKTAATFSGKFVDYADYIAIFVR